MELHKNKEYNALKQLYTLKRKKERRNEIERKLLFQLQVQRLHLYDDHRCGYHQKL